MHQTSPSIWWQMGCRMGHRGVDDMKQRRKVVQGGIKEEAKGGGCYFQCDSLEFCGARYSGRLTLSRSVSADQRQ